MSRPRRWAFRRDSGPRSPRSPWCRPNSRRFGAPARDQFTGAAIGGAIGVTVALALGSHLASYAAAVMVSIVACWLIGIASSARLAGTTATIILLVPHSGSPISMMIARISEVGWGVTTGVLVVWLVTRLSAKKGPPASLHKAH